jgi:ATP-dependent DNA helicase PIF1
MSAEGTSSAVGGGALRQGPGAPSGAPRRFVVTEEVHEIRACVNAKPLPIAIFVTGGAGRGKTAAVRHALCGSGGCPDDVALTAMTGTAACTLGGRTLYSWMGMRPQHEDESRSVESVLADVRRNPEAVARWRSTRVLVVSEVSMLKLRAFTLIDVIGRAIRGVDAYAGGLALVFEGDFLQVGPVNGGLLCVTREWKAVISDNQTIHMARQWRAGEDPLFAAALDEVRAGSASPETRRLFDARVSRAPPEGAVRLVSLKNTAARINASFLAKLPADSERIYAPSKRGNADVSAALAAQNAVEDELRLRSGAHAMLTRNLCVEMGFANGTCGVIDGYMTPEDADEAGVLPLGETRSGRIYPVLRVPSGRRALVGFTKAVAESRGRRGEREVLAQIDWMPLQLAWAITIHKSQSFTLEKAHVDLSDVRRDDYGIMYTALSRTRSFASLTLESPVPWDRLAAHPGALAYYGLDRRQPAKRAAPQTPELEAKRTRVVEPPGGARPAK